MSGVGEHNRVQLLSLPQQSSRLLPCICFLIDIANYRLFVNLIRNLVGLLRMRILLHRRKVSSSAYLTVHRTLQQHNVVALHLQCCTMAAGSLPGPSTPLTTISRRSHRSSDRTIPICSASTQYETGKNRSVLAIVVWWYRSYRTIWTMGLNAKGL